MLSSIIPIVLIVFAAAVLQGFSGFGFGLLFMGLSSLIISTTHASILGVLMALVNTAIVLWSVRHSIDLSKVKAFFIGAIPGVPIGVWGLAYLNPTVLARILGVVLISFCGFSLLKPPKAQKPWPTFWCYPMGVLSGVLGGSLNIAGPPIIIYSYYQPWSKESIKAALVTFFLTISFYKVALLFVTRLMTGRILLEAVLSVPLLFLGSMTGIRLSRRCDRDQVRRAAFLILIVLGVLLLVRT